MRRQLILTVAGFLLVVSSAAWAHDGNNGEGGNTGVHGAGAGGGLSPSRPSRRGEGSVNRDLPHDGNGGGFGGATGGVFGGIGFGGSH